MLIQITNKVNHNEMVLIITNNVFRNTNKPQKAQLLQTPQTIPNPIPELVDHGAITFICTDFLKSWYS